MNNNTLDLPARTMKFIDCKVGSELRKGVLNHQDGEDLRQDMCLAAIIARDRFEPDRGASLETFLEKAALDGWRKFYRSRGQSKRACLRLTLDQPMIRIGDNAEYESGTHKDFIEDENDNRRDECDRRMDIESCLKKLHGLDREVFQRILEHKKLKDIATEFGLSDAQLRLTVIGRIKRTLSEFTAYEKND